MATFKPGDRVRVIANKYSPEIIGCEAVLLHRELLNHEEPHWYIDVVGRGTGACFHYCALVHEIAPLTPPAADTWAADKVRLVTKPLHVEPVRVRETEPHNQGKENG